MYREMINVKCVFYKQHPIFLNNCWVINKKAALFVQLYKIAGQYKSEEVKSSPFHDNNYAGSNKVPVNSGCHGLHFVLKANLCKPVKMQLGVVRNPSSHTSREYCR